MFFQLLYRNNRFYIKNFAGSNKLLLVSPMDYMYVIRPQVFDEVFRAAVQPGKYMRLLGICIIYLFQRHIQGFTSRNKHHILPVYHYAGYIPPDHLGDENLIPLITIYSREDYSIYKPAVSKMSSRDAVMLHNILRSPCTPKRYI